MLFYIVAALTAWYMVPAWCAHWVVRGIARMTLLALGYREDSQYAMTTFPDKFVWVGGPHTHLSDIVYTHLVMYAYNLHSHVLQLPINQKYFVFPLNLALYAIGGFPVNTSKRGEGIVASVVNHMQTSEKKMMVALAPSGTRSRTEYWRSGFYHIARLANVPVVATYLCSKTNLYGSSVLKSLSGNLEQDMEWFRKFYKGKEGVVPANTSPVRLRNES